MVTTGIRPRPVKGVGRSGDRRQAYSVDLTTSLREDEETFVSIEFELSTSTMVTVALFSDDGRLVEIPFEGWLGPGPHSVECCLKNLSFGRYKCLLDTPNVRLVKYIEVGINTASRRSGGRSRSRASRA